MIFSYTIPFYTPKKHFCPVHSSKPGSWCLGILSQKTNILEELTPLKKNSESSNLSFFSQQNPYLGRQICELEWSKKDKKVQVCVEGENFQLRNFSRPLLPTENLTWNSGAWGHPCGAWRVHISDCRSLLT
jgi:hypothetical protein